MISMLQELEDYTDVLMGRTKPPHNNGVATLVEIANAYYSRAKELEMLIYMKQLEGKVKTGDPYYKFRTGALRSFIDLSKAAMDLGSRRITVATLPNELRMG